MNSSELRTKFLDFFEKKGHKIIPSASLIPENDPTVLFTTAGMHPLVPFLLGEKHPSGKRLVSCQKCIRTGDIDDVGDDTHLTFFEMLGNWSLGDYWKEDAIRWSFEFLTKELGIPLKRLAISCFAGDKDAPKDEESAKIWLSCGIKKERIAFLPKEDNWWGPAGQTGPCGPDTEMFYWKLNDKPAPEIFDAKDKNWVEIWNDVFMQYVKDENGNYIEAKQKNVDTGMGLERTLAVLNGKESVYETDLFLSIIKKIEELSRKKYESNKKEFRIIADHIKASVFLTADGLIPSKDNRGYVLRRLIRGAIDSGRRIGINERFIRDIGERVIYFMVEEYKELKDNKSFIVEQLASEEEGYDAVITSTSTTIATSTVTFGTPTSPETTTPPQIAEDLFKLRTERGIKLENTIEEFKKRGVEIPGEAIKIYKQKIKEHQDLSRTASAGMFKGGLADASEETTKLHTAAHLMLAGLRKVLGEHVMQKGSNINSERLRFDFSHKEKMTEEQIDKTERFVNDIIERNLPVAFEEMSLEKAKELNAMGAFESKYGKMVKVYTVGSGDEIVSREICGGPHVDRTGILGHFKIQKEESSSSGVRRIKAILE